MNPEKDREFWNALKQSRRIRSPLLGWSLIVLGLLVGLGVGWAFWGSVWTEAERRDNSVSQTMNIQATLIFGMLACAPFVIVGMRFLPREARDALRDKEGGIRPFVLYLRAFRLDGGWHGWMTEFHIGRVFGRVGVPVCVGRPGERLPPAGFHRIYFADADWQRSVLAMAARAKCIVLVVDATDGLRWEIQRLIDFGLLARTILLVPAGGHEGHRAKLLAQHGLDIPKLEAHYQPPYSPHRFDLCPVVFRWGAASPVEVVPQALIVPYPFNVLDYVFRFVAWVVMLAIPPLKRFRWIIDRSRSAAVNYARTLEPVLKRLDGKYSTYFWERFF